METPKKSRTLESYLSEAIRKKLQETHPNDRQCILSQPISELSLPLRIQNLLEDNSLCPLKTVGDVLSISVEELTRIPQFGQKSVRQVVQAAEKFVREELGIETRSRWSPQDMNLHWLQSHVFGPSIWWNEYQWPR